LKSILQSLIVNAKRFPSDWARGFSDATGALVGLVVSDNLLGFTKTPFANELAAGLGVITSLIGIASRNKRWGFSYRKRVMNAVSWMFASIGLILLGIGAEKQLGVFAGPIFSLFNFWTAIFLVLAIFLLGTPLFVLANWSNDGQNYIESLWKKRQRIPTIFNSDYVAN
jgi:hypothetical protein